MRRSPTLTLLAALVVVIAAGAGGFWWWRAGQGEQRAAVLTAERFAEAWEAGEHDALAATATAADAARDAHAQAEGALDPEALTVAVTEVDTEDARDGEAAARLAVAWDLGALGEWDYDVEVALDRTDEGWRVSWDPTVLHPDLDEGQTLRRTRSWPERAAITDAEGATLAGPGEVVEVGVQPGAVEDADAVAEALAEATPAEEDEVADLLARDDLEPDWFYEVVVLTDAEADEVRADIGDVPGTIARETGGRELADPALAGVLGTVEEATAEQLEDLGAPYEAGDRAGRRGLERAWERELAGEPGGAVEVIDEDDAVAATLHEDEPVEPEPVAVTLDADVQAAAAQALADREPDAEAAVAVVDVDDAAVRALVDAPEGGFPRGRAGAYPPGSTFKVVTAAALLEHGLDPGDTVTCPETTTAGGREIRNAGDLELGEVPFAEAVTESCNTAFVDEALALPDEALAEAATALGFGAEVTVAGSTLAADVPEPADTAEEALAAIGQGRVSVAPLHMASVIAGVASGRWDASHLRVDEAEGEQGPELAEPVVEGLEEMLREAVTEGTGTAADVDGAEVRGKTGTAEVADGEHAWFVGWSGDLAFAVLVEEGGAGGETAAPIAGELVEALAD